MKRGKRGIGRKSSPKQTLNLPDLDHPKSSVFNSLPSQKPQRGYRHAIGELVAWYCPNPGCRSTRPSLTPGTEFTCARHD